MSDKISPISLHKTERKDNWANYEKPNFDLKKVPIFSDEAAAYARAHMSASAVRQ